MFLFLGKQWLCGLDINDIVLDLNLAVAINSLLLNIVVPRRVSAPLVASAPRLPILGTVRVHLGLDEGVRIGLDELDLGCALDVSHEVTQVVFLAFVLLVLRVAMDIVLVLVEVDHQVLDVGLINVMYNLATSILPLDTSCVLPFK